MEEDEFKVVLLLFFIPVVLVVLVIHSMATEWSDYQPEVRKVEEINKGE